MVRRHAPARLLAPLLAVLVRSFLFAGENVFKVEDVLTAPGTHFLARLYLTHHEPLQGFEVSLLYDSTALTLKRITMQGTDAESLLGQIEVFVPQVVPDYQPGLGLGLVGVMFDWIEPYDFSLGYRAEPGSPGAGGPSGGWREKRPLDLPPVGNGGGFLRSDRTPVVSAGDHRSIEALPRARDVAAHVRPHHPLRVISSNSTASRQ